MSEIRAALAAVVVAAGVECALLAPALAASLERLAVAFTVVGAIALAAVVLALVDVALGRALSALGKPPWVDAVRAWIRVRLPELRAAPGGPSDRRVAAASVVALARVGIVASSAAAAVALLVDRFRSDVALAIAVGGVAAGATVLCSVGAASLTPRIERFARRGTKRKGPSLTVVTLLASVVLAGLAIAVLLAFRPAIADDPRTRTLLVVVVLGASFVVVRVLVGRKTARRADVAAAIALSAAFVVGVGVLGPRPEVRGVVRGAGLLSGLVAQGIGALTDFDGDGTGLGVGGGDCAAFDPAIHPDARDVPENGVDENCSGADAVRLDLAGEARRSFWALPADFPRDLSIALVVVDSVRADVLGVAGYRRRLTPKMDRFARSGAYFTDAWSNNPGTHGSFRSLLTSIFPRSVPVGRFVPRMGNPLRPEARTMAEALRESGLTTSAILSFRYFDPGTGFDQGFDHYDNEAAREGTLEGITAPTLLRKVQAEIARLGDRRFFLFLHVLDPHHEYLIHPGYPSFGRGRRDRYDAEIAFSDDYVGRMLAAIEGGPQGGRTLVVLAADHGEAFGEHGVVYHNTTVYQEMLRIPLVARLPGARPRRLEAPVSLVDLLPTFLNVVGRRATGMVGHSFLGAVATGREDFSRIVYAETTDTQQPRRRLRRATSDSYALVHDATAGTFQLFDRRRDPGEERPLAGGGGAEGERLRMALEAFEAQERRARP